MKDRIRRVSPAKYQCNLFATSLDAEICVADLARSGSAYRIYRTADGFYDFSLSARPDGEHGVPSLDEGTLVKEGITP
jgi:hypothetical protein